MLLYWLKKRALETLVAHALHAVSQKMAKALLQYTAAPMMSYLDQTTIRTNRSNRQFFTCLRGSQRGTLILEDIERLPVDLQGKLLDKLIALENSSD